MSLTAKTKYLITKVKAVNVSIKVNAKIKDMLYCMASGINIYSVFWISEIIILDI